MFPICRLSRFIYEMDSKEKVRNIKWIESIEFSMKYNSIYNVRFGVVCMKVFVSQSDIR